MLVYLCHSALLRHTALRSEDHQPAWFPMRRKPPTWMRKIGALLLHAPLVASQDCTFVSGTCLPAGCTDTTLSFPEPGRVAGKATCNLCHFERVGEAGAIEVAIAKV